MNTVKIGDTMTFSEVQELAKESEKNFTHLDGKSLDVFDLESDSGEEEFQVYTIGQCDETQNYIGLQHITKAQRVGVFLVFNDATRYVQADEPYFKL